LSSSKKLTCRDFAEGVYLSGIGLSNLSPTSGTVTWAFAPTPCCRLRRPNKLLQLYAHPQQSYAAPTIPNRVDSPFTIQLCKTEQDIGKILEAVKRNIHRKVLNP
jgi:hypothetical protein